jgi:DNA processing protein
MMRTRRGREELSRLLDGREVEIDWGFFDRQVELVERHRVKILCFGDADYPPCLREIAEPPPLLFYKGEAKKLKGPGVAVVGTRKPSPGGESFARSLARDLSRLGITVASGLARGIDRAAHEGALDGRGGTVAVVGTGLDMNYPAENAALAEEIAGKGCIVSEQLMGTRPSKHVFPRRNRLISAFSRAVVVVEAGPKSGALITAKWALEQGRDVGAVPGFPGDFRSRGVNGLLRKGAFVVEGVEDILEAVPSLEAERRAAWEGELFTGSTFGTDRLMLEGAAIGPGDDVKMSKILSVMSARAVDPDVLSRRTGIDIPDLRKLLAVLEMHGKIASDSLGCYFKL